MNFRAESVFSVRLTHNTLDTPKIGIFTPPTTQPSNIGIRVTTCRMKFEGVGVKVDFEKAYDRLNWAFLHNVMEWWGFSDKWCGWIQQCVENTKVVVLVNGESTN